jgi:hypothetical protein
MHELLQILLHNEFAHFLLSGASYAFINGMPAPTKDSGVAYCWAFRSLHIWNWNWSRAKLPQIEDSPNFQDALDLQMDMAGLPRITARKPDRKLLPVPGGTA